MTKDNVSEFLGAYNDLQNALKKRLNYKGDRDFSTYLYWAKDNNDSVIMNYYDELNSIREFRNILTHESTSEIFPLANPNEKLIERMKFLIEKIGNHKTVGELFKSEVKTLNANDSLKKTLEHINTHGYSQYPVFDKNKLIGIITENGITNFLAKKSKNDFIDLKGATVLDVLKIDKDKNLYEIVDENTSVFEVEEIFENQIRNGNSAYVVLISNEKEPIEIKDILGIITPWDVPKMLEHM